MFEALALKATLDCRKPLTNINCDNVYRFILHEKEKLERLSLKEKMYMIVCYSLFNEANRDQEHFQWSFITYQLADMLGYEVTKKGCIIPVSPFKLKERRRVWNNICIRAGLKS